MKGKILVTDFIHPIFLAEMTAHGWTVDYEPEIGQAEVDNRIKDYQGVVINSKTRIYATQIEKSHQLKFIARMGSGMEIIDTEFAASRNIVCISAPEGNRDAVGEHALGMILSLFNNLHLANAQVKEGSWLREENRGLELGGKTIGILGFGNTGSAFAKKLQGLGVAVLAYDKYKTGFSNEHIREGKLDAIFNEADILSIHLPLTDETRGLVNTQFLKRFQKSIYFINTARGKIVNTPDLLNAITTGKVIGAALDVLENEDIENLTGEDKKWYEQLVREKRVMLTPHVAGWSVESKERIARVLAKKIKEI